MGNYRGVVGGLRVKGEVSGPLIKEGSARFLPMAVGLLKQGHKVPAAAVVYMCSISRITPKWQNSIPVKNLPWLLQITQPGIILDLSANNRT